MPIGLPGTSRHAHVAKTTHLRSTVPSDGIGAHSSHAREGQCAENRSSASASPPVRPSDKPPPPRAGAAGQVPTDSAARNPLLARVLDVSIPNISRRVNLSWNRQAASLGTSPVGLAVEDALEDGPDLAAVIPVDDDQSARALHQ